MLRIHFSDRVSCARMAGSCSASRITIIPTIGDLRHARLRSGRARSARLAHVADQGTVAAVRNGWPHVRGFKLHPASSGDHPGITSMYGCAFERVVSLKFSDVAVPQCGAIYLSAQPFRSCFRDGIAVGRRNLSVVGYE